MSRYRVDFLAGVASGVTAGSTTISGYWQYPAGTPIVVPSGSYIPVIFNPGYFGIVSTSEIAYVTAVNAGGTVATVVRAQEGTTAITGSVIPWVSGPTAYDFDVTNLTSTGTLTVNNGITLNGTTGLQVNAASGVTIGGTAATGNLVITHAGGFTNTLTTQSLSTSVTNTLPNQTGTLLNTYGGQTISNGLTVLGSLGVGQNLNVNGAITSVASGITINGGSQLNGGVTVNGGGAEELTVYGGAKINGNVIATGDIDTVSNLNVWNVHASGTNASVTATYLLSAPNGSFSNGLTAGSNSATFPLATNSSYIASAVGFNSSTNKNIVSITLGPGEWHLVARVLLYSPTFSYNQVDYWLGPYSASATSAYFGSTVVIGTASSDTEYYVSGSIDGFVTLGTTTTIWLNVYGQIAGTAENSTSNLTIGSATGISATQVG